MESYNKTEKNGHTVSVRVFIGTGCIPEIRAVTECTVHTTIMVDEFDDSDYNSINEDLNELGFDGESVASMLKSEVDRQRAGDQNRFCEAYIDVYLNSLIASPPHHRVSKEPLTFPRCEITLFTNS